MSKIKVDFPEFNNHLYGIFALAECFTKQHITNLIMSDNDLTEEFITQNICHLKHLIHIDISNNKLTDLPYFIFNLPHLETITLSNNNIKALSQRAQLHYYTDRNDSLCNTNLTLINRISIERNNPKKTL